MLVTHGGAAVPGIGGAQAVAGLCIDAYGIYKPDVTPSFGGITVGVESLLKFGRKFFFQLNFIR